MSFADLLKNNFVRIMQENARKHIEAERNKFNKVWEILDQYCSKNEIIFSNRAKLLKLKPIRESANIYCMNPFKHALEITNLLHKNTNERLIVLNTVKQHEELNITIDTRQLINIYCIHGYRNLTVEQIINPIQIDNLKYMPPEIELIELYNDLYNINKFGDWEQAAQEEQKLFEQVEKRNAEGVIGAAESLVKNTVDCKKMRQEIIEGFKVDIMEKFIKKNNNVILIGTWGHTILSGKKLCADVEKVQIISSMNPEKIIAQMEEKLNFNFEVVFREQLLNIPKDFRTLRYTFYAKIETRNGKIEKPFMDVFNNTNFEIVPYNKKQEYKIGAPYVILRFMFIDIWIMRIIEKLGYFNRAILKMKLDGLLNISAGIRKKYADPQAHIDGFDGIFRDYSIDKKIAAQEIKSRGQYIPEKYLIENGSYWQV